MCCVGGNFSHLRTYFCSFVQIWLSIFVNKSLKSGFLTLNIGYFVVYEKHVLNVDINVFWCWSDSERKLEFSYLLFLLAPRNYIFQYLMLA